MKHAMHVARTVLIKEHILLSSYMFLEKYVVQWKAYIYNPQCREYVLWFLSAIHTYGEA